MQTRHFLLEQRSRRCSLTVTLLLVAALLNINTAAGRPDVRQSPFSLELQPPLAEATPQDFERAIDSYGNPIDALRPIDTPDGRKVISAQGVQFEIPNYASGITEIRKPADDLLPPHIDPTKTTTTTAAALPVEPNPFDSATLPPWLQDFDYPDVGPGVPYNPDNFKDTGDGDGAQKAGAPFDTQDAVQPNQQQFPPFSANPTVDSQKVEYTKSDDGKVISTPINNQRKDTQDNSVLQGPSTTAFLPTPTTPAPPAPPSSNTGKYTGGFGAPAGLLRPHNAGKPDIYVAGDAHDFSTNVNKINRGRPAAPSVGGSGGRYTGGFGAPSGVLSPQNAPRPFQQAQPAAAQQANPQLVAAASSQVSKQNNRFGGPPGILVPFDNVQRTGGQ